MHGKTINGFTLQRLLGVGGMAEVWYAENEIHKPAAVKILNEDLAHNAGIVERFRNEAEIMVRLNHPNIRQVYGYGTIEGRPAIIMEYLDGNDLKALLKRGRHFTAEEYEKWWNQMVDALNYTHAQGIVHRDIKPSNIFVDTEGNVKLLDFGIAKIKESISMTQTGAMMGTLMYMSPEQVRDSKHIGLESDVYSLAVSFVHLLSGKRPYDSDNSSDYDIRKGIVEIPLDLTGVPGEWRGFLAQYLAKDPTKRPALRPFDPSVKYVPTVAKAKVAPNVSDADEGTVVMDSGNLKQPQAPMKPKEKPATEPDNKPKGKKGLWIGLAVAAVAAVLLFVLLKPDPDTEAFKACQTVKDYREYLAEFGRSSKHYTEAKQFVDRFVTDSIAKVKRLEDEKKEDDFYNKCSTIADCDTYLNTYPNGRYVAKVKAKKSELEQKEESAYEACTTFVACEQYLKDYPNGKHIKEVQQLKKDFQKQLASQTITVKGVSFVMKKVEGGTFQMGSNDSDAYHTEKPVHSVTVSTFYMGETEVTQALWKAVMGSNPSSFKGDNLPVEEVSWNDCQEFIRKLNQLTGKNFRLPTEAEWEYAARGRKSNGYKYAGSNSIDNVAVYNGNCHDKGSSSPYGGTHRVKSKQPNELGLYDMSGNVQEWCSDWHGSYSSGSQTNPKGPSTGWDRVCRGGYWDNNEWGCRVSYRSYSAPDRGSSGSGFRLVLP